MYYDTVSGQWLPVVVGAQGLTQEEINALIGDTSGY